MSTNYIAPIWRMPRNFNKDNLSNYSIGSFADGSTSSISTDLDLSSYNSFSISTWVKADTLGSGKTVCAQYRSGSSFSNSSWLLYVEAPGGTPYMTFYIFSGGSAILAGKNTVLSTNQWYHIVATWDGSTSKLYINGSKETTEGSVSSINTSIVNTLIGASNDSAGTSTTGFWDGYISQTSIFDYALSTDQINYLYNLNNPMVITGAEPIAYWPLGDNSNPNATAGYPNISVGADSVFDFIPNDYINLGEDVVPATPAWTSLTVSGWVKKDATGSYGRVIGKDDGGSNRVFLLQVQNNDKLSGSIRTVGGGTWDNVQTTTDVAIGEWQHVAMTYTANGLIRLYINGQVEASGSTSIANLNPATTDTLIGAKGDITNLFDGQISNVQIWDVEISPIEMIEVYNNGQPLMTGTQPQEANLQAWYKLNQTETWDEGVAPFSVEKVGSPDYTNAGDGCFTTSGVLRWQDTGDQLLSSGNYFTYLSPVIYASAQDVDLITTGGTYESQSSELEYSLEYSVDGGAWVVWKTEVVPSGTSSTAWTVGNVNNLNVDRSIQIRLRATGGLFGTSNFDFNDVRINVNGHKFYEETFGTASKGWLNGAYDPPTDYWKTPEWIISDASAPYQKSMNINAVGSTYISDRFNSYEGPRGMNTNVGTYSCWVNLDTLDSQVFMDVPGYASREFLNFRIRSNGALQMEMRSWSTQMLWDTVSTTPLTAEKWHHIAAVGDGSSVVFYIDGQIEASYLATGSYRWWNTFATLSYPNVGHRIYLGSGTYPTRHSPMNGRISNAQIWNTNLSGAQILDLYNNGKPLQGTQPAAENLLAWYKLDENDSSWINYNYNDNVLVNKWNVKNSATPTPTSTEALNLSGTSQDGTKESFEISNTAVNGSITLSVWYKATGSGIKIFDFESSGSIPYASVRFNSDDIYIYSNDNSSRAEGAGRINLSYSWTNVIIHIPNTSPTFDATQIRWWQNGVEEPTLSVIGSTTWNAFQEVRGLNVGSTSTAYAGSGYQLSNWAWFEDLTINDANIETIYNSGTPGDLSTLNPKAWYKLNSTDITFGSSGPKASALSITDSSSNGNNATGPYDYDLPNTVTSRPTIAPGDVQESIVGNNMTEGQLQRPAVSALNGESSGMNTTNLVQSNLTRTQPYSNYSFNFDQGASDYFNCGNVSVLQNASVITWNLWVNFHTQDFNIIFGKALNTTDVIQFYTWGSGVGYFWIKTAGTAVTASINPFIGSLVNLNEWNMFSIVFDGTQTGNDRLKIYLNGGSTNIITNYSATPPATLPNTTADFFIGRGYNGYFNGQVSNLSIWDSDLTFDDINNLYNNGVPQDLNNFRITPTNWWPLDENSSYYGGADWITRDVKSGQDGDGANTGNVDDLVGNAPGSEASGTGTNLTIADLIGDMKDSKHNAYSINMADYADGVTNPAASGRSTDVP